MTRLTLRAFPLAALTLALAGCGGNQNTLAPKGKPEHAISHLWWWTMTGAWIGFAVVCGLLFLGWLRRNRTELPFGGEDKVGTALVIGLGIAVPVQVIGTTDDVIHSFWIPQLNRKIDLIPGRSNRLLLEADSDGTYEGHCSEFCGLQHAHMTATVIAEPPAAFRAWLENMAKPARTPADAADKRGREVFLAQPCAACHRL